MILWEHGLVNGTIFVTPRIYINPYEGSSETNPEAFRKNVEISVYYMRIGTDGANGGTWEKVLELVDDGNWSAPADSCSFLNTHIITRGGGVVFIRNTNIAAARYKWFTLRKIEVGN